MTGISKELTAYYEARFELFSTKGWSDLIEDIDTRIAAISSIKGIKGIETLNMRKGELDALEWLKSLPEMSEQAYKQLQEEDSANL